MQTLAPDSIAEVRITRQPAWGQTQSGYTLRRGSPTRYLVRLKNEKRWRRVLAFCFSNNGSIFLRRNGETVFIHEHEQPVLYFRKQQKVR